MAEVGFHGLDGHMELLGDLPVGSPNLGELGDGGFWGAELVRFTGASSPTGSPPFHARSVGVPAGPTRLSDLQRLGKRLSR